MANLLELFVISFNSYVNEKFVIDENSTLELGLRVEEMRTRLRPILTTKTLHSSKLPLKYDFCINQEILLNEGSAHSMDEIVQHLAVESENWSLCIQKCSLSSHSVLISLNRSHSFKQVLSATRTQHADYGKHPHNNQTVVISSDIMAKQEVGMDLTHLRVHLVRKVCSNLLNLMGYCVKETVTESSVPVSSIKLIITQKSVEPPVGYQRLLCGAVLNAKHNSKETQTLACDYYTLRMDDMKTIFHHKYGSDLQCSVNWKEILSSLQDAAVKIDLLCIKPCHTVAVNLDAGCMRSRVTKSKGASFWMYNYARIAEILKKYYTKVTEGYYPPLVPIEDIDFSLLSSQEEWELLLNFILKYPGIIEESTSGLETGNLRPDFVCTFITAMCCSFSVYYSRIRILTEPRKQLLPVMFARLYLLHGIQQVLSNGLHVFDIVPISQM